jgi:hypothetical protein
VVVFELFLLPDDNPASIAFAMTKERNLLEYPDTYGSIVSIVKRDAAMERAV